MHRYRWRGHFWTTSGTWSKNAAFTVVQVIDGTRAKVVFWLPPLPPQQEQLEAGGA